MVKEKKKYSSGSAKLYLSRAQALKKLQVSLRQFRRLCILKGIHPHEPKHIRRVNRGSTERRTFYFTKDIQYLASEPILQKLREQSAFFKKLKRAKALREHEAIETLKATAPTVKLDHVVRERYPTLSDACRDLDDALCLLFIFARLPSDRTATPPKITRACRRLTTEFMHYVIETRSLRKCFVSIKGIYYQADICGETVTWIVPHERPYQQAEEVDFKLMTIFIEFYIAMLGFVNYALYAKAQLVYPPKLQVDNTRTPEEHDERIRTLLEPIQKRDMAASGEKPAIPDEFEEELDTDDDPALVAARAQQRLEAKLPTLFNGVHAFAQRETPTESLAFVIRACGGTINVEGQQNGGRKSASITHQIVDRPIKATNKSGAVLSRMYVQPQWVYDCVNMRTVLPGDEYAPGVPLPPHLSPFIVERVGDYVPQERIAQLRKQGLEAYARQLESGMVADKTQVRENQQRAVPKQETQTSVGEVVDVKRKSKTAHHAQRKLNQIGEQRKLQETMLPKKHRRAYKKLVSGEKKQRAKNRALIEKRQSTAA